MFGYFALMLGCRVFKDMLSGGFYRAMLSMRGTSRGPVSVCHKSVFYRNG